MNLTLEQKLAVETDAKNVLVSAAAGSGKTSVITERLRYLITEKGVDPKEIICITFTKNAAEELKERLADINSNDLFIGTIHSFAYDLLGGKDEKTFELFTDKYDNEFHEKLIRENAKYLTYNKWKEYKNLQKRFNKSEITEEKVKNFLTDEERRELDLMNGASLDYDSGYCQWDFKNYWNYTTIVDLCDENNVITFDELINLASNMFNNNNIHIKHVLVDEFQDVGDLEYRFIKSLNSENYYFCGDDFQSIYGFKGADPSIFVSLSRNKNFKVYKLTKNFRCDMKILALADVIIQGIPTDKKLDKIVIGNSTNQGTMEKEEFSNELLLEHLQNLDDDACKSTFILTRGNGNLQEIKTFLYKHNIKTISFNQADFSLSELKKMVNEPYPKLLTIHASKGLEADNVFLIGGFDEKVPEWKLKKYEKEVESGNTPKFDIWEEQRIYYVGVTRARHNLTIMKTNYTKKKTTFEWNPMDSLKLHEEKKGWKK